MWAGLLFSYSQSSMVALIAVTLAVAAATGGRRVRMVVAGGLAAVLLAGVGYVASIEIRGDSLRRETSDRTQRVEDTVRVVREDPLVGAGIGGQASASRRLAKEEREPKPTANFVSHTTPLTVAAELGAVGLALYVWLIVGGARAIAGVARLDRGLGIALGAALLALFVHALFYSGFLEDPLTWLVLAIAAGTAHLAAPRRRRAPPPQPRRPDGGRLSREGAFVLMGVSLALLAITLPELGSNPWPFRTGRRRAAGRCSAPLVRAAGEEWDVGIARAACFLAALVVALLAAWSLRRRDWPAWGGTALAVFVALALLVPSTLLQVGLRDATEPWFHTNDSTYQIELGGELLLDGENPYGADYRSSGMERFYTRDGSVSERVREREVSLEHYAYFPGTAVAGAAWRLVPSPFDDYRMFVLLMTLAGFAAAMAFRAPLSLAAHARPADRGEPDRRALGVVRAERRALDHPDGAGVRAGHPGTVALGGGGARRRGAAEAVRRGGDPVPRADDGEAGRAARRAEALRGRVRGA